MEAKVDYRIYPSLLIAYQNLLDYEIVAEEDWNKVSEAAHERGEYLDSDIGDYKLTPDEMYLKLEADLLNQINRCPKEPSEAADKGTVFNEIVDCLIENRKPDAKIQLERIYDYLRIDMPEMRDLQINEYINPPSRVAKPILVGIKAKYNGWEFDFDIDLCKKVAKYFDGSITQFLAEATMETSYGNVLLYGYIDEWVGNKMFDIKTTGRYSWGKFEKGWQRHIYPWCVIESGMTTEVESFEYYVIEWAYQRKGDPISAKGIYRETYTYSHEESGRKIREMLESFICWLESRKEFIQDKRIYGGVNQEGWHGQPVDIEKLEKAIFRNNLKSA